MPGSFPACVRPRPLTLSGHFIPQMASAAAQTANSVAIVPSHGDPDGSKFKAYQEMYEYSIKKPEEFWAKEAMVRTTSQDLLKLHWTLPLTVRHCRSAFRGSDPLMPSSQAL